MKSSKTASTSVEFALGTICGMQDIITPVEAFDEPMRVGVGGRNPQFFSRRSKVMSLLEERRRRRSGEPLKNHDQDFYRAHLSARQIKRRVGEKVWSDYHKAVVVRNPFDTVVSDYFWLRRRSDRSIPASSIEDFRSWLFTNPPGLARNNRRHWIDGVSSLDSVIYYENLLEDLRAFSIRLDIPSEWVSHLRSVRAKGSIRDSRFSTAEFFDGFPEGVAWVKESFRDYLEEFEYREPWH